MENKNVDTTSLKYLKKHYGEDFAKLCRKLFPTILEEEGVLKDIITSRFGESRNLYNDIVSQGLENEFKNFVYDVYEENKSKILSDVNKTPEELLSEAGYILYPECKTESDIQKFKKYYAKGEELCTFNGGRLNSCRVWFAVKKDVDKIKREDFEKPQRQDKYGTSVISIQFSKDEDNTLSIKNRYNHAVANPDATFSNGLENIIPGLTNAFEKTYGLNINVKNKLNSEFNLLGYVRANNEKLYRYNGSRYDTPNSIFFCENNVFIDQNRNAKKYDKERYIVLDNYLLDLKEKNIVSLLDGKDSFTESIGKIKDIKISVKDGNKDIIITPKSGKDVIITINDRNQIIGYKNSNVTEISDNFLYYSKTLKELELPKVKKLGDSFLCNNDSLTKISLPEVEEIGDGFLYYNKIINGVDLPKLKKISDSFLCNNDSLTKISLPEVEEIGDFFLYSNEIINDVELPKVKKIGNLFLYYNNSLTKIRLPEVEEIGNGFLYYNKIINEVDLPNLKLVNNYFLDSLENINYFNAPNLIKIGKTNFREALERYNSTRINTKNEATFKISKANGDGGRR